MNNNVVPQAPTNQPGIPAGWYPDGAGAVRWWNGVQWTEHVQSNAFTPGAAPTTPAAGSAHVSPPRDKALIPIVVTAAIVVLGALVGSGFIIANMVSSQQVSVLQPEQPYGEPTPTPSPDPQDNEDSDEDSGTGGLGDVFAEREQFFKDQQLPFDGSPLRAVTPEQKQFIEQLRSEYELLGTSWSNIEEELALALAGNACETSILNNHKVDEMIVRSYALTSPLIAQLTEGLDEPVRISTTNELMRIAATGTNYMCQADASQWENAYNAINGSW